MDEKRRYLESWRVLNKEKVKEYGRRHREKYREQRRDENYKRKYGISTEEYSILLAQQKEVCSICGQKESFCSGKRETPNLLSVDHCHETGKVRGLLCYSCNTGLGKFKDNPTLLQAAILYLKSKDNE